jgi:FtsP/CotA-like multicopper oxidase with cupredoxin domain
MRQIGRRELVANAGGMLICTLAGQKVLPDKKADVAGLAEGVEVPPKVEAARRAGPQPQTILAADVSLREYWIKAEPVTWDIVPSGRDAMMDRRVKGKTKFSAYGYRQYTADFAEPMGKPQIPGPLIEADVGDTIIIHFQNKLSAPVTIHPHGVQYSADQDGAYKGRYTDPGGFVQKNEKVDYTWEAIPESEGAWFYHDHGPMDPLPLYKGLFGPMIIRDPNKPRPDREFFVAFHSFQPVATGLNQPFWCINGHAYAGNEQTLRANVGDDVAFHVYAIDDDFHTFHVHGHRWLDPAGGRYIDNFTLGPGDGQTARFTEDNPGRWFYHCHVFSHLHQGMSAWYIVE